MLYFFVCVGEESGSGVINPQAICALINRFISNQDASALSSVVSTDSVAEQEQAISKNIATPSW